MFVQISGKMGSTKYTPENRSPSHGPRASWRGSPRAPLSSSHSRVLINWTVVPALFCAWSNATARGWQTVPGIGLPAWYVGASPQGIQQRSTDSAGRIMATCIFPVGVRWIGPRTARGGGLRWLLVTSAPWRMKVAMIGLVCMATPLCPIFAPGDWASVYGNATMPNFHPWTGGALAWRRSSRQIFRRPDYGLNQARISSSPAGRTCLRLGGHRTKPGGSRRSGPGQCVDISTTARCMHQPATPVADLLDNLTA